VPINPVSMTGLRPTRSESQPAATMNRTSLRTVLLVLFGAAAGQSVASATGSYPIYLLTGGPCR
jgi:hypothetical protein